MATHRYGTPKRRDHRRPPEKREETAENGKDSFARSLSSSHFALRTLLPSSAFSCQSPPHLPPLGLIRCSKKSIRLSLPTRSSVFSFYGACVRSTLFLSLRFSLSLSVYFILLSLFLSLPRCDTLFASHAERSHYNERERRGAKRQDDSGGLNANVERASLRPPSIRHS